MKGMNHELQLLTGNRLEDFMIKDPLPALGSEGLTANISPLADRPLLTMVSYQTIDLFSIVVFASDFKYLYLMAHGMFCFGS